MKLENIIILEDSSKAKFGGGQNITLKIVENLKKKYKIVVADCSEKSIFNMELKKQQVGILKLLCAGDVSKSRIKFFFELLVSVLFTFLNLIRIYKYFKLHKYRKENTVLYAMTKKALFLTYILHRLFHYPFIYHAHMVEKWYILKVIKYFLFSAKEIVCVSEVVEEQLKGFKTIIVYNPIKINSQVKVKTLNKNNVKIATISSLNYIKGIEYFMKSYQYLNVNYKMQYEVYGDGEYRKKLQKYENENIILKGYINDSVSILIDEVDILVVPSIVPESFGMVILEAFSCGVPVISTDVGMQKILIENSKAGKVVKIENSKEIADAISSLLINREEYILYSKNAIKFAKNFNTKIFNDKIENIFKDCDITSK